jgi:putative membrane protein
MNKDLILREKLALQRTHLANQTTFLAYLRTSMYFLVAGLSLENLLQIGKSLEFQVLFYGISSSLLIFGIINYFIQRKRIKQSEVHIGDYKSDYLKQDN